MANRKHLKKLKQGADIWNQWRKDDREIKPDISGANLKNAKLFGANFSDTDIRGVDFRGADLSKSLFIGANTGRQHLISKMMFVVSLIFSTVSGFFSLLSGIFFVPYWKKDLKLKIIMPSFIFVRLSLHFF
ncbi:MAG: pentapeptide repeat-containing protein [Desulfobacteraceae bacterium]|nr:pentapeptide repeat-containing protein [Desulfobacteraceae bacterium]